MSILYLLALVGVGIALIAALVEAVLSVSRKPDWSASPTHLHLVSTVDRRAQQLRFVGADRRSAATAAQDDPVEPVRLRA